MATGGKLKQVGESNRKKFSNWLQCINALNETKTSLHESVLEKWKGKLISWDKDMRDHIPRFLSCVSENKTNTRFKKRKDGREKCDNKKEWFCSCDHIGCNKILVELLELQQNPGLNIIWNSGICEELAKGELEIESDDDIDEEGMENIPRVETSILAVFLQMLFAFIGLASRKEDDSDDVPEIISLRDIFDGCKQEHVWCIANMFMQHGKAKTSIINTGPGNTDASMFFKMMRNCKLFYIEDENYLYDDILRCRDRLHHSATNRISSAEAETYLKTMIAFLKQFAQIPSCDKARENIEKMLQETILSVSVPDKTIRELSEKAFDLKKSALEVDKEIDISDGFSCDETNDLLEKTKIELKQIKCLPSKEVLNTGSDQTKKLQHQALKDPGKHFENISKLVKKYVQNEEILEALTEQINPLLDHVVEVASEKDKELGESLQEVNEQERRGYDSEEEHKETEPADLVEADISCQFDNNSQLLDNSVEAVSEKGEDLKESPKEVNELEKRGYSSDEEHKGLEPNNSVEIDISSQFDNNYQLLNHVVEAGPEKDEKLKESLQEVNEQERRGYSSEEEHRETEPNDSVETDTLSQFDNNTQLLDHVVEAVSAVDKEPGESLQEVNEQERRGYDSEEEHKETERADVVEADISCQFDNNSQPGEENVVDQSSDLEVSEQMPHKEWIEDLTSNGETATVHNSNVWTVVNKQECSINLNGDSAGHGFFSCCRISPAELLVADRTNKKLKKLDNRFQVIKVLELDEWPFDICYLGNNECVVALPGRKLQFYDTRDDMTLTKKVDTNHDLVGMAFYGKSLFVIDDKSVYIYNIEGKNQQVMYTHRFDYCLFRRIAVSANGSNIYITCFRTGLITIDSSGNYINTFFDSELEGTWGVCVDDKGHVLVCGRTSANILQISHDGKRKIGTIENKVDGEVNSTVLFFDTYKDVLISSGTSGKICVLKLKK